MRRLACLPLVLCIAACGPGAPSTSSARVEVPAAQTAPAVVSAPAPAPAALVAPIDERFATTREGWRVDYHLRLPALQPEQVKGLRHACTAWLFQGLATPRPTLAASGEAALAALIADGGKPDGTGPWFSERAVVAMHQGGGWLALRRSESSCAGQPHANSRIESLIIKLAGVRALTLDEVVPPERQGGLRLLLAAELRRSRGLPADGPLTSEIASDAELPIPVPLLNAQGARFLWNPCEIGPYSDGEYEVVLSAAQVRGFLAVNPW